MQRLFEQDFCEKSANIEFPLSVEDKLFINKVGGSVTKLNGHLSDCSTVASRACDATEQPRGDGKALGILETEVRARCRILCSIQRKNQRTTKKWVRQESPLQVGNPTDLKSG